MKKIYKRPFVEKFCFETPFPLCSISNGKTDRTSEIGGNVGGDDDSEDETLAKQNVDLWADDFTVEE